MVEVTHLGLLFFFPSTLFPFCLFKRSRSAASQASSDDVHEKVKMNRPFWSKHPSIKPKAGLPRRVCSFYSESTHTHTHTLLLPPSTGEKCLRFQSGCTNLPSFFLAFQTNRLLHLHLETCSRLLPPRCCLHTTTVSACRQGVNALLVSFN